MPSRVVTKRRIKRRQQRLISKNAKRNARSVRKYRKTARKVMRGGLFGMFEWKNDFDVVDIVDIVSNTARTRKKVFTLSVTKKISGGYDITLIFDIDAFPEIDPKMFKWNGVDPNKGNFDDFSSHNREEEDIVTIIMKLIESIGGKMIEEAPNSTRRPSTLYGISSDHDDPVYTFTRLRKVLPDKFAAIKAQWYRNRAIEGGIGDSRLHRFLEPQKPPLEQQQPQEPLEQQQQVNKDNEDEKRKTLQAMNKVTRKCEIKMTLKTDNSNKGDTHDVLVLNEFTVISKKEISTNTVFEINKQTFTVYEWENMEPEEVYKKIATFKPSFTPETLKGALDALQREFYIIKKPIQSDSKKIKSAKNTTTDADVVPVPEAPNASDNIGITFENGDTFVGKYVKKRLTSSDIYLVLFTNGRYTWKDGTSYTGDSFTRNWDVYNQMVQVLGFNKKKELDEIVTPSPSQTQESEG